MDAWILIKAAVMGIVEGVTEFLPISSTGHLILAGHLLDFGGERAKVFEMVIQTGAILAVVLVYWQKIQSTLVALPSERQAQKFALNVAIGFFPAVLLGLTLGKAIQAYLFTPTVVACSLVLGGFVILWAEQRHMRAGAAQNAVANADDMTWHDALKVGLVQCTAMVPGVSRSGATIIGGMLLGLSRKAATDYSFYLAIPTLIGAGVYSLYKDRALFVVDDVPVFAVGLVVSFIFAYACVRWLLKFISTHNFVGFAYYRIVFGVFVLVSSHLGWLNWGA